MGQTGTSTFAATHSSRRPAHIAIVRSIPVLTLYSRFFSKPSRMPGNRRVSIVSLRPLRHFNRRPTSATAKYALRPQIPIVRLHLVHRRIPSPRAPCAKKRILPRAFRARAPALATKPFARRGSPTGLNPQAPPFLHRLPTTRSRARAIASLRAGTLCRECLKAVLHRRKLRLRPLPHARRPLPSFLSLAASEKPASSPRLAVLSPAAASAFSSSTPPPLGCFHFSSAPVINAPAFSALSVLRHPAATRLSR